MRRDVGVWLITGGVLLTIALTSIFVIVPSMPKPTIDLKIGSGSFKARLATNHDDRVKGLSGISSFDPDLALIMIFPKPDKWGIWMKDMQLAIDILWLNEDKRDIYIKKNTLPSNQTTEYKPKAYAKYVIELPAGMVDSKSIETGSLAVFQYNETDVE